MFWCGPGRGSQAAVDPASCPSARAPARALHQLPPRPGLPTAHPHLATTSTSPLTHSAPAMSGSPRHAAYPIYSPHADAYPSSPPLSAYPPPSTLPAPSADPYLPLAHSSPAGRLNRSDSHLHSWSIPDGHAFGAHGSGSDEALRSCPNGGKEGGPGGEGVLFGKGGGAKRRRGRVGEMMAVYNTANQVGFLLVIAVQTVVVLAMIGAVYQTVRAVSRVAAPSWASWLSCARWTHTVQVRADMIDLISCGGGTFRFQAEGDSTFFSDSPKLETVAVRLNPRTDAKLSRRRQADSLTPPFCTNHSINASYVRSTLSTLLVSFVFCPSDLRRHFHPLAAVRDRHHPRRPRPEEHHPTHHARILPMRNGEHTLLGSRVHSALTMLSRSRDRPRTPRSCLRSCSKPPPTPTPTPTRPSAA